MPKKLSIYIGHGPMVNIAHLSANLIESGFNFTLNKGVGCWKDEVSGEVFHEEQTTITCLCLNNEEDAILSLVSEFLQTETLERCLAYDVVECQAGFRNTQLSLVSGVDEVTEGYKVKPSQINPGLLRKPIAYNPWLRSKLAVNDSEIPTIN